MRRELGTVKFAYFKANIVPNGRVVHNGTEMSLTDFISLGKQALLIVQGSDIATEQIARDYNAYYTTSKNPKPYQQWRTPEQLKVLGCVLGQKLLPPPDNQLFCDKIDDLITELENSLEASQLPITELLQKYAVKAGDLYEACMLEIQLEKQAIVMRQRMEMKQLNKMEKEQ
jgi:hypothetical protein